MRVVNVVMVMVMVMEKEERTQGPPDGFTANDPGRITRLLPIRTRI